MEDPAPKPPLSLPQVAALHAAGVAHLDISTPNLLLDDGDAAPGVPALVIHDFGMARAVAPGERLLFTAQDCLMGKVCLASYLVPV